MKRIDNNFKLLVAIVIVLGLSLSVMAQPEHKGQMQHPSMKSHVGFEALDLTEAQKDQMKSIHLAHLKDVQPLKDEVKINRAKINALLNNDDPDMKEIVSMVESNGKLLTQVQIKSIDQKIEVRSLLTDEQKIIFDAQSEKMEKRRAFALHHQQRRSAEKSRF